MRGLIRLLRMNQTFEMPTGDWDKQPDAAPGGILLAVFISTLFWAVCLKAALTG